MGQEITPFCWGRSNSFDILTTCYLLGRREGYLKTQVDELHVHLI